MANNATKISGLNAQTAPVADDVFVIVSNTAGNAVTMKVSANTLLNNTAANIATNVMSANTIAVSGNSTPANNSDAGTRPAHSIWADGTYMYYYDGATIKRMTLDTF